MTTFCGCIKAFKIKRFNSRLTNSKSIPSPIDLRSELINKLIECCAYVHILWLHFHLAGNKQRNGCHQRSYEEICEYSDVLQPS